MTFSLKPNLFTVLLVLAGLGFFFRLVNIATFDSRPKSSISVIMPAEAVEASDEEPPLLDKAEIEKDIANTAKAVETLASPGDMPKKAEKSPPPPVVVPMDRAFSASEIEVLQNLSKRRDDLEKRERSLTEREALLRAAEQEVDRKVTELNKLKGEIETLLGTQEKMEEGRIVSLVKIYEGMKPKEAATIFNTLDMDVLLAVVGRMSERKASPILASMDPEKARIVTIKLAEQRKLPEPGKSADVSQNKENSPAPVLQ